MSVARILSRIENATTTEAAYEAQQMLKTVYHRLRSRRKLQESYDLLQKGARLQLERDQLTCGSELALLLIHDLESDGAAISELHCVLNILEGVQKPYVESRDCAEIAEATKIANAAIRWVKKLGSEEAAMTLHVTLAKLICRCQGPVGLLAASDHFSRGDDPSTFAAYLAECSRKGAPKEHDLFLLRAVLQVLAAGNEGQLGQRLAFARALAGEFQARIGSPLPATPLAHFLDFFLKALEACHLPMVELLQREYSLSLACDPDLNYLLESIKHTYFPTAGGQGMGGILGNIFQMMGTPTQG